MCFRAATICGCCRKRVQPSLWRTLIIVDLHDMNERVGRLRRMRVHQLAGILWTTLVGSNEASIDLWMGDAAEEAHPPAWPRVIALRQPRETGAP